MSDPASPLLKVIDLFTRFRSGYEITRVVAGVSFTVRPKENPYSSLNPRLITGRPRIPASPGNGDGGTGWRLPRRLSHRPQKRAGRLQVDAVEALGEPIIDRLEKRFRTSRIAVTPQQPGEARGRAQFPGQCALSMGKVQGSAEMVFRGICVAFAQNKCLPFDAESFWRPPQRLASFGPLERLVGRGKTFVEVR
jgi:hypothetical protein